MEKEPEIVRSENSPDLNKTPLTRAEQMRIQAQTETDPTRKRKLLVLADEMEKRSVK